MPNIYYWFFQKVAFFKNYFELFVTIHLSLPFNINDWSNANGNGDCNAVCRLEGNGNGNAVCYGNWYKKNDGAMVMVM